jgi:hypothetical protein
LEGTDPRNALSLNGQFVTGEIFAKEKFSTVKQPAQNNENQTRSKRDQNGWLTLCAEVTDHVDVAVWLRFVGNWASRCSAWFCSLRDDRHYLN